MPTPLSNCCKAPIHTSLGVSICAQCKKVIWPTPPTAQRTGDEGRVSKYLSDEEVGKMFDERFELEIVGCSECGGTELIDKTQLRYPKGSYHCEWGLEKIKSFITSLRKSDREAILGEVLEWAVENDDLNVQVFINSKIQK